MTLDMMVGDRGLGRVGAAAAIVAVPVNAQAVAELVALASRVAGAVRLAVGPVGPGGRPELRPPARRVRQVPHR